MSKAEACLWKNEFQGLSGAGAQTFWARSTSAILYKVVLVLKNKCLDSGSSMASKRLAYRFST